jgi:hypothetical protein
MCSARASQTGRILAKLDAASQEAQPDCPSSRARLEMLLSEYE